MKEIRAKAIRPTGKTIIITIDEYKSLVAKSYAFDRVAEYVGHCDDFINDDIVRALLGVDKPNKNYESEGD